MDKVNRFQPLSLLFFAVKLQYHHLQHTFNAKYIISKITKRVQITSKVVSSTPARPISIFFPSQDSGWSISKLFILFFFYYRQQELSNLIADKNYLQAISLAITLDQPFRVMHIIKGTALHMYLTP